MKKKILQLLNLINFILVTYSIVMFFVRTGEGNMQVMGVTCFRYFTIDSNILSALASILAIYYSFKNEYPNSLMIFKHLATVAVMVTFLTVVFFLGPLMGYKAMFAGTNLYLHLICPIISLITYLAFDVENKLHNKQWFSGLSSVLIYGIVYMIMIHLPNGWPDFYMFDMGGKWYISAFAMLSLTTLLSYLMHILRNKLNKE